MKSVVHHLTNRIKTIKMDIKAAEAEMLGLTRKLKESQKYLNERVKDLTDLEEAVELLQGEVK